MTMTLTPPGDIQKPIYSGSGGAYYGLYLTMWLLMALTLGMYRFWGKTKVRRYMWSHVSLYGESFAYLGRGSELFVSAIKFVLIVVLPASALSFMSELLFSDPQYNSLKIAAGILPTLFFLSIVYAAKFMGLRYRLARTSWRGIRFELRGSAKAYMALRIKNGLLNLLSLGLYRPIGDIAVLRFTLNKIYYGNQVFRYRGTVEELQKTYYLCWLLFLPTFGLSMFWYRSKYIAHVAKHTVLGDVQFRLKIGGGEYIRFAIGNFFLLIFTLGLGYPLVVHRRLGFYLTRARMRGTLNYEAIAQAMKSQGGEGAELSLGFDDFGF